MKNYVKDMTSGEPIKLILWFALPVFLGNIFQQFYNIVDTAIAGRCLGDNALAAIGATTAVYGLVFGMANGMNNGYAILIAQAFGAKNEERLKNHVALMLLLNLISGIIFTLLAIFGTRVVLETLKTPAVILDQATSYILVILCGILITIAYNMEAAILRSLGNSKTPLLYLIFALVINIILDLMFVYILKMGLNGLAYATVIAQLISVIFCFHHIKKHYPILKIQRRHFRQGLTGISEMLPTGLSMGMMYSIVALGTVCLQGAINQLGPTTITAHLAARKILEVVMLPLGTMAIAGSTFVGQNYGAKKMQRVKEGIRKSCMLGLIWSLFVTILIVLFAPLGVKGLTGTQNDYVIRTASKYLYINVPFFFILTELLVLRTSLQSLGRKIVPLVSSSLELAGKIVAAYLLIPILGYLGVCIIEPITWVICAIWMIICYRQLLRKIS